MKRCCYAVVLGLSLLVGSTVVADAPPVVDDAAQAADESRSQSFQAVDGAVEEDIAGGPLMLAAYAFVWLAVFGYVLRLIGLQRRTLEEIAGLRREIDAASSARPAGGASDAGGGAAGDA